MGGSGVQVQVSGLFQEELHAPAHGRQPGGAVIFPGQFVVSHPAFPARRAPERGRQLAEQVMRKHRLAERLLVDVIGLDWQLVHEEACRWEHVISDQVERRLVRLLDNPVVSPYGNPIPGLADLDAPASAEGFLDGVELLSVRLADGEVHQIVVARMSEAVQGDVELLGRLAAIGVAQGRPVPAQLRGHKIVLGDQDQLVLPLEVGDHLFVRLG